MLRSHCLSIDVEGFVEGMEESFEIPAVMRNEAVAAAEIERNVDAVLEFMSDAAITATFFILGRIAEEQPRLIAKIAAGGHEIGSHSRFHKRIFLQTREQFREDLRRSKHALEDAGGQPVKGFRAPDFSIIADSLWALEELQEAGFVYDSSLVPTDIHDVYGVKGIKPHIHKLDGGLWEWPAATFSVAGKRIPFGGGGYLRLYPVAVTRNRIKSFERKNLPCMLYMHPYELGPVIPRIDGISFYRRFRHYYHTSDGIKRLARVLRGFKLEPAIAIIEQVIADKGTTTNGKMNAS